MSWRCLPFTAMEILWAFVGPRCLYLNGTYAQDIFDLKRSFFLKPLQAKYQLEVTKTKYIEVDGLLRMVGRPSFSVRREVSLPLAPACRLSRRPPAGWRLDGEVSCSQTLLRQLLPETEWVATASGCSVISWHVHRMWVPNANRLELYLFLWGDY